MEHYLEIDNSLEITNEFQIDIYEMQCFLVEQNTLILNELGICEFEYNDIIQEGAFDKIKTAIRNIIDKLIAYIQKAIRNVKRSIELQKVKKYLENSDKFIAEVFYQAAMKDESYRVTLVNCTDKGIKFAKEYKSAKSSDLVDEMFDSINEIAKFYKFKKYAKLEDPDMDTADKMAIVFKECPKYHKIMEKCDYNTQNFRHVLMDELHFIDNNKKDEYIIMGGECTPEDYVKKYLSKNNEFVDSFNTWALTFDSLYNDFYLSKLSTARRVIDDLKYSSEEAIFAKAANGLYKLVECIAYSVNSNIQSFNYCMQARNTVVRNFNKAYNFTRNIKDDEDNEE